VKIDIDIVERFFAELLREHLWRPQRFSTFFSSLQR
jgi:hypothetical protein